MTVPSVVGAVLCGGASRRMGRDKALIVRDGQPLALRVAGALATAGATTVCAVGGDEDALVALGLEVVADRWPGQGPLGGLATALSAAPLGAAVVVAPCDLLDPDPELIRRLLGALASAPASVDVCVPVVEGRHEWIHSAWRARPALTATIAGLVQAGHRRLGSVAEVAVAITLREVSVAAVDDADRPEDLERTPRRRPPPAGRSPRSSEGAEGAGDNR